MNKQLTSPLLKLPPTALFRVTVHVACPYQYNQSCKKLQNLSLSCKKIYLFIKDKKPLIQRKLAQIYLKLGIDFQLTIPTIHQLKNPSPLYKYSLQVILVAHFGITQDFNAIFYSDLMLLGNSISSAACSYKQLNLIMDLAKILKIAFCNNHPLQHIATHLFVLSALICDKDKRSLLSCFIPKSHTAWFAHLLKYDSTQDKPSTFLFKLNGESLRFKKCLATNSHPH